jgi:hypothetical protein
MTRPPNMRPSERAHGHYIVNRHPVELIERPEGERDYGPLVIWVRFRDGTVRHVHWSYVTFVVDERLADGPK